MNVQDLYEALGRMIESGRGDYPVVVVTANPSMGGRACSEVKYASRGIDWESGRFNLVTEDEVVKMPYSRPLGDLKKEPIELKNLSNLKNPE